MEPQNGPWPLMGIAGAVLGVMAALGGHLLVAWLRRVAPLPLAVVGWLAIALIFALTLNCLYFFARGEDKSGISLMVASLGILILLAVAGFAAIYFKRDQVSYLHACGHLMVQFGGAALLCYAVAQVLPNLAAWFHGGKPTDDGIVHWFPPVHFAGDWFYGTFLAGLVLLEVFRPFRYLFLKGG